MLWMIRPANPNDAAAIAAIHVRAWQVAYEGIFPSEFLAQLSVQKRSEFWHRELSENRSTILVAEREDRVVGWVSGGQSRDSDAQGEVEVYAVYVEPEFWRHGIGRELMGAIEERISVLADVTVWVLDQNKRAIDFYRKMGYELDGGRKTDQIAGVAIAEVRLRKKQDKRAA